MRASAVPRSLGRKTASWYNGLFGFGTGALAGGFYPVATGGQAKPPINAVRSGTGAIITPDAALAISAAWACTWLIADTISSLPFILNRRNADNVTFGAPAFDKPLYAVIGYQPNQQMTACEFWQMMLACELLWGNAYAKKTVNSLGDVINLEPMRPESTIPYRDPKSGLIRYKYYPFALPIEDYSADEIFVLKDRSVDGLIGLSRIQYARNSLGIAKAGDDVSAETFKNQGRMAGFLSSDKLLQQKQRDQLRESLEKFRMGGPDAAGFMVLEAGLSFGAITMNPQDVELLSSRQFSVEDVCRWWGVPPVLIGHASAGVTAWGSGIEQLMTGFKALTLRPHLRRIEQAIWRQLLTPADRVSLYVTIDADDLLAADSTARAALWSSFGQNGVMTRNEIRAKEDLPPMAGGDQLTVQSNLIPLEKLGTLGGQPTLPPPKRIGKAGEELYEA